MKQISVQIGKSIKEWVYQNEGTLVTEVRMLEVVESDGHILRIDIVSALYSQRCYARVEVLDGVTWREIAFRLAGTLQMLPTTYSREDVSFLDFAQDRDWLLVEALKILKAGKFQRGNG